MKLHQAIINVMARPFGVHRYHTGDAEQAIGPLTKLLGKARSTIHLAVGEMNHRIYEHQAITGILEAKADEGVQVEITHSPEPDEKSVTIQRLAREGKLSLYRLPESPVHHFWVIDGQHVLDEDPHARDEPERVFYILYDAPFLASALEREFQRRKAAALNTEQGSPVR